MQADEVLSFVPQTFIDRKLRMIYFDRRDREHIRNTSNKYALKEAFDLKKFLNNPGYAKATVFADKQHRLDAIHARRIMHLPKTSVVWRLVGHALVKDLRESGELQRLLHSLVR